MGDLRDGETPGFCDGSAESVEVEGGFDLFPMQQEQGAEEFGKALRISILSSSLLSREQAGSHSAEFPEKPGDEAFLTLPGVPGSLLRANRKQELRTSDDE